MKTRLVILTVCAALLSIGASAKMKEGKILKGDSGSEFGNYTIVTSSSPMTLDNQAVTTYDLTYELTNDVVRIGVVQEKKCTVFVVRSDQFEVQYTCNKGVFGVKKIAKKYQQLPTEVMDAKLNKTSYFAQRVICQNKKSDEELLGLIACYFPSLVNEEYQASFYK